MTKFLVRIFTNYSTSDEEFALNFPGNTLDQLEYRIILNTPGEADLAIVLNYARPGMWVMGCHQGIFKVTQDPPQPGLFGRFTRHAPSWADLTLTAFPDQVQPRARVRLFPAIFNWHLGLSYDQIASVQTFPKTKTMSCIASKKRDLPGHKVRDDFVGFLEANFDEIDVFGRGRVNSLDAGKLLGLSPYRFSIAIENVLSNDYFTEKILDCWLAGTVPVYFGALNLENYFPRDSFIRLESLDPQELRSKFDQGLFGSESYEARKADVLEARRIVMAEFSMNALVKRLRSLELPPLVSRTKIRLSDVDSISHALRDWIVTDVLKR